MTVSSHKYMGDQFRLHTFVLIVCLVYHIDAMLLVRGVKYNSEPLNSSDTSYGMYSGVVNA